MKLLLTLALLLSFAAVSQAASPVYPATTNVNQTFYNENTFLKSINGSATNAFIATNAITLLSPTNSNFQTVNMGIQWGKFQTNQAFAWLGVTGISNASVLTAVVFVTNTTGAAFNFTAPATCHTQGTLNVTNVTECVFLTYGLDFTNLFSLPLW